MTPRTTRLLCKFSLSSVMQDGGAPAARSGRLAAARAADRAVGQQAVWAAVQGLLR